ncbi:MAG TPA: hypothetical protein VNM22_22115 [Candidatus Limnocylindrales bacterium]|nr:hypothetical protein [Candidatus Limnocylindrales bacterium]
MRQGSSGAKEMAQRLLTYEAGGLQGSEDLAKAADHACQKLYHQMVRLVGLAGFQALLMRSLNLAKTEFPFLRRVESEPQAGECLKGILEAVQDRDPVLVGEGLVAVLANFIGLLITFIGKDLALRLIRKTWPEVTLDDVSSGL